ncbi:MAG: EamA family transporter [Betaproteobacteria bacterium]|nr:EamA family transporter [Betaproteobacteria bacterium]
MDCTLLAWPADGGHPRGAVAWGQRHIASGLGGTLFATIPIMSVLMAPLLLAEETFSRHRLAGALVGLAGVVLLIGPSVLARAGEEVWGISITLPAPLSHTLGATYARRPSDLAPPVMATGQAVVGTAFLTPLALLANAPLDLSPGVRALGTLLVAVVACTALGMGLYFVVVRRVGASRSSVVPLLMPMQWFPSCSAPLCSISDCHSRRGSA